MTTVDTPATAKENIEAVFYMPEHKNTFWRNASPKVDIIQELAEVYLARHNAFLDPRRYPLAKSDKNRFDALYIARSTPFKRHELAQKVKNLHLLGSYSEKEKLF